MEYRYRKKTILNGRFKKIKITMIAPSVPLRIDFSTWRPLLNVVLAHTTTVPLVEGDLVEHAGDGGRPRRPLRVETEQPAVSAKGYDR